jgi:HlyD family secretion protein
VATAEAATAGPALAERRRLAAAQREAASAALRLALARLAAARAGPAPTQLRAAEAAVAAAAARLGALDAQRARLELRAPITGVVALAAVRPGESVTAGAPLVTVVRQDPLELRIFVPEAELDKVEVGQAATVQVDGLPDEAFDGEVVAVADEPQFTPRNVQTREGRAQLVFAVTIRLPNGDGRLRPGMAGTATLEVDE